MLDRLAFTSDSSLDANPVPHEVHGSMILDLFGVIRFCSRDWARLMRRNPSDLTGRAVRRVFPDLAFSEKAPGYNVSLAKVMFAHDEWYPLRLACETCGGLMVDAALESVEIQERRLFHVDLRWPSRQSPAALAASTALASRG